ncbi:hypothetical protein SynRS9909_02689 [Synechococcus sp. RS9909]|uniref:hypothetical protein n=1 Tax=unclassified Synechococcus TaxID=2626047 RepID=UPI000069068B|nr:MULTISPECIES: hypothetical protein [unclassified Synechococcus]EAQ70470.1 hypothetical protein RS9917_06525 [Synechococcus sp. RS9917]QNI80658.1 hypothetical protein SynRS9909_02689 [Synechococcus sp. RS9909]
MNHLLHLSAVGLSAFSLAAASISFGNAAQAQAITFRCYDRASGALVAVSAIDLSSSQVSCTPGEAPAPGNASVPDSSPNDPLAARRSINLARGTAVKLNGGLNAYRPASCMFAGATDNPCLTIEDGAFLFNIPGGPPGWEQTGDPPSVQTILKIAADGRSVLDEVYNGPPRAAGPR